MKASELINKLEAAVKKYGDIIVKGEDGGLSFTCDIDVFIVNKNERNVYLLIADEDNDSRGSREIIK